MASKKTRASWSCGLPRHLLLDAVAWLPLEAMPSLARTCIAWSDLSVEAFAQWLRWRRVHQTPRELRTARFPFSDEWQAPSTSEIGAQVGRAIGCIDWHDACGSALVVSCAEPVRRDVFTARIPLATLTLLVPGVPPPPSAGAAQRIASDESPESFRWLRRHWPYHMVIGGLAGGMVGRTRRHTAFFPSHTDGVIKVERVYQNILRVGMDQTFLLRPATFAGDGKTISVHADVLGLSSQELRKVDVSRLFDALRVGRHTVRLRAVSATCEHFVLHGTLDDGSKVATAARLAGVSGLPPAQTSSKGSGQPQLLAGAKAAAGAAEVGAAEVGAAHLSRASAVIGEELLGGPGAAEPRRVDSGAPPVLPSTFAKRWGGEEPISSVHSVREKACGGCLLLHPGQFSPPAEARDDGPPCCLSVSVLHAESGRVDDVKLRPPRDWQSAPLPFWQSAQIMDLVMDRDRSVVAACIRMEESSDDWYRTHLGWPSWAEPGAGLAAVALWAVPSGISLAVVDLRAVVASATSDFEEPDRCSVQALLHPTEPLLVLGLSEGQRVQRLAHPSRANPRQGWTTRRTSNGRRYRVLVVQAKAQV
jgi:hypothetical protein